MNLQARNSILFIKYEFLDVVFCLESHTENQKQILLAFFAERGSEVLFEEKDACLFSTRECSYVFLLSPDILFLIYFR